MAEINEIAEVIYKLKTEKQRTLQRAREIDKITFEYEMRLFLLSKKKEISHPLLKTIEKKVTKKFSKS
jgi:hypothetical protein